MVHVFATLCFALIGTGAAFLIWAMLSESSVAIVAALGMEPVAAYARAPGRRSRIRSAQPAVTRAVQVRRAA